MFKKTAILTAAIVAALIAATVVPAQAIPTPPPNSDVLVVVAYYSDANKTQLVGQSWSGCGSPSGSWGTTSGFRNIFFTPC